MSYEIIYEKFATKITREDLYSQIHEFIQTHFRQKYLSDEDAIQFIQSEYKVFVEEELISLYMVVGSSNCYYDDGRRARDWQFHGIKSEYELFKQFGCEWTRHIEDGSIKPNGRWVTAEGWLKSLRGTLKSAFGFQRMPTCGYMEARLSIPTSWEDQHKLLKLQKALASFGGTVRRKKWCGTDYCFVELTPKSMFEMWLFQQLLERDHGFRWINAASPSMCWNRNAV
ncbi:hypothetical protein J4N45_10050 [Vibrio sp. SCSIO 43140]|uniref:hypothetical protein n=1 Tax=Vibrio sp. SCSIO 43140 TaxID=2819100 RepID=UPI0020758D64|nr:hypothetical protein [Vibrio sp. SCSIO 43140]USD58871.1 hypothetical protein J4N45_10050 [Vibrio sp. SCSIO 43140]